MPISVVETSFHAAGENIVQRRLFAGGRRALGHKDQTEQALPQLVDDHCAQGQWIVFGSSIGIGRRIDHDRRHTANGGTLAELAPLHAGHQHHQRVIPLIGNHVRIGHADRLRIRVQALRIVFPHFDQATQIIPAAYICSQQAAPQNPGDCRQKAACISFLVENLDFERAGLNSNERFDPCQQLLDDERLLRRLYLWDVVVNPGAETPESFVIVQRPEHRDGDDAGHGFAIVCNVVKSYVNRRRPHKSRGPLRGRPIDLIRARLAFLHDFIGTAGPTPFENILRIL